MLGELDEIRKRCEELRPGCTEGPWNSIELVVRMPENTEVILTAAQPLDPDGPVADRLRAVGFDIPQP
ncbi:hypothetical protein [Amycolatopsis sulphurea]|uniref:hypothetical protein n=1 Tax=Amycolatopsis sulphurea TaxID=76022 RepID=UPI001FE6B2F5|nr:hypothetical protein [Amycolatopsis sulphurea]